MEKINKNSLIIFGYSEIITIGLVINSKLNKVKEFNILDDDNEDKFFKVISSFISNKEYFNHVLFSCGPGSFTTIRRILSYVKALKFNNFEDTKFIGLNHLSIIACYLNQKCKLRDKSYILSILNYSRDNFIQIYQKKRNFLFFLKCLSDIKNIDLDHIGTYLETLNLPIQNVHPIYLGADPNKVSFLNNILIVDRSNILEIIINLYDLIENNKICQINYRNFLEEKFDPLYGKLPSTN